MRLAALAILLALLAAPPARAGSERDPEIDSPEEMPNPAGDILAVWYEHDEDGLAITFKVAFLPERASALMFYTVFDLHGETREPGVGYDGRGRLQTDSGANPSGWGSGRLDNALEVLRVERGEPAYITVLVPWGLYDLAPGDLVRPRFAASSLCCDPARGDWYAPYDEARAQGGTFAVRSTFFPILVPAWVLPTILVVCTLGGLGAGLAGARVFRRKTAPPAPPPAPPERALPPPGERFQRAPPPKR